MKAGQYALILATAKRIIIPSKTTPPITSHRTGKPSESAEGGGGGNNGAGSVDPVDRVGDPGDELTAGGGVA